MKYLFCFNLKIFPSSLASSSLILAGRSSQSTEPVSALFCQYCLGVGFAPVTWNLLVLGLIFKDNAAWVFLDVSFLDRCLRTLGNSGLW